MGSITSPVTTIAPEVASFGAGGQQYIASLRTGFNVSANQVNELFAFSCTDTNVPNARVLTNITEPRKVGSTMAFRAVRLGLRIVPLLSSGGPLSPTQLMNMKQLLQSADVTITVGSNDTKIAEFSGLDLMEPIDTVASDTTATAMVSQGLGGGIGWIPLAIPIEIQANCNIGGTVRFSAPVPLALLADLNAFGFVVILQGLKVVKS